MADQMNRPILIPVRDEPLTSEIFAQLLVTGFRSVSFTVIDPRSLDLGGQFTRSIVCRTNRSHARLKPMLNRRRNIKRSAPVFDGPHFTGTKTKQTVHEDYWKSICQRLAFI